MDAKLLISAISKAIQGGAALAVPIPGTSEDDNYIRARTDVSITSEILNTYLAELKADPGMAAMEGLFADGVSVDFSGVAKLLLAQAIASNDVAGTVARFIEGRSANSADVTAVLAISGIVTDQPVKISDEVSLIPMLALQPSMQRGIARGNSSWSIFGGPRLPIPCALTTKFKFRPVWYKPKNPQPPEDFAGRAQAQKAERLLGEARNLLSLLDLHPVARMYWVQPDDLLMSPVSPGWSMSPFGDRPGMEAHVPVDEVQGLGADYFSIEPTKRAKFLRIPLDRLSRAGRDNDLADQSIDLGIALESLLLHDRGQGGELTFTLSYRGAWLLGTSEDERREIQKSLQKMYALRSRAVHRGEIEPEIDNYKTIYRATEICKALVRRVIALKCEVNWEKVMLGGEPSEQTPE